MEDCNGIVLVVI